MPTAPKIHKISTASGPLGAVALCTCGWIHREHKRQNALGRASKIKGAANRHLREVAEPFRFEPATDDSVDAVYVLKANPDITIQDCRAYGGGWVVGVWLPAEEAMDHYPSCKTLAQAKAKAVELNTKGH